MQLQNLFQNMSLGGGDVPSPETTMLLSELEKLNPSFKPSATLIQALNELSNFQMLGGNAPDDMNEQEEYRIKEQLAEYMMERVQTITGEVAEQFLEYVKKREEKDKHGIPSLLPGSSGVLRKYLSQNAQDLGKEMEINIGDVGLEDFASTFWHDLEVRYFRPLKEGMMILQREYNTYFRSDFPYAVDINDFSMNDLYEDAFPLGLPTF